MNCDQKVSEKFDSSGLDQKRGQYASLQNCQGERVGVKKQLSDEKLPGKQVHRLPFSLEVVTTGS